VSVLTIVETVLLLVALVYIVALLRSHADILRRLTALEEGGAGFAPAPAVAAVGGGEVFTAGEISGTTLAGDSVMLSFGAGAPITLLAFLTSGCASCAPLWAGLRGADAAGALADRVVVVTHDTSRESPARVRRLAPEGVDVVMASSAWEDYAVPASPHFVLTDGAGGILGRGSALSWTQLVTMVADARAEAEDARAGADGARAEADDAEARAPARTTAERAARSERMLSQAGIGPGHPSLYPGAAGQDPEPGR
jgi:hypothetical protein